MKRINAESLLVGDIVLTTSPSVKSKVIRGVTKSDISHAMICVSQSSVMDSTGDGVQARNPQKMIYPDDCAIHILRLKEPLDREVANAVVSYVRQTTGTPYATAEAMRSAAPSAGSGSSKQFCSRLVARAFASVGVQLCDNPDFCTPEELKGSQLLVEVTPAWVHLSDEEADALEQSDATAGMREVTKVLLAGARVVLPTIAQLSDTTWAAIQRPDLDASLADVLIQSGYLDYWRTQEVAFPWRYDLIAMIAFAFEYKEYEGITEYCRKTLQGESDGDMTHWSACLETYENLCADHQRRVLELERDLYRNLVQQHAKRIAVAKQWMRLADRVG